MPTAILFAAATVAALMGVVADTEEKIHEGIVFSTTADTLVMTDKDGKNEHSHKIDAKVVAITIDGKPAKLAELSKGDKIKVALGEDGNVIRVAATRRNKDE
jgi:hypothetical protein